jgi:hypothetical protein
LAAVEGGCRRRQRDTREGGAARALHRVSNGKCWTGPRDQIPRSRSAPLYLAATGFASSVGRAHELRSSAPPAPFPGVAAGRSWLIGACVFCSAPGRGESLRHSEGGTTNCRLLKTYCEIASGYISVGRRDVHYLGGANEIGAPVTCVRFCGRG